MPSENRLYTYVEAKHLRWVRAQAKKCDISCSKLLKALVVEKFLGKDKESWDPRVPLFKATQKDKSK